MIRYNSVIYLAIFMLMAQNCTDTTSTGKSESSKTGPVPDPIYTPITLPAGFADYWYQGKAELCTYDVVQERYGEIRQAEQVNIFVTEDFSKSKQVKLDDPGKAGSDRIPVLKLNALRRFETGIYDYSLMQSIFTPTSGMPTLKTTATIQDWCGHVFMQTNLMPDGYRARIFSYFENEGDQDLTLPLVTLEDELWASIRLNPAAIKTGKTKLIPSAFYSRLRHKAVQAEEVEITLDTKEKESLLNIQYTSIPRTLQIRFESSFPYKILGWEESNEGKLASKGTLKASRKSAYWGEHDNIHAPLRDSLLLNQRR